MPRRRASFAHNLVVLGILRTLLRRGAVDGGEAAGRNTVISSMVLPARRLWLPDGSSSAA
jgi:hypothetical protein